MSVQVANTAWSRLRGLLGREDFEGVLLLERCNDVHTFGMRFPLDIAFIADDGMVLHAYRGVEPRCRLRCKTASAVLERFASEDPWLESGEGVELENARAWWSAAGKEGQNENMSGVCG